MFENPGAVATEYAPCEQCADERSRLDGTTSYHDVVVYVGDVAYRIADNYALQLHCTRTAGWRLYEVWEGKEKLIGGEYEGAPFCIEVAGVVILGSKPVTVSAPAPFGWTGEVSNG